MDRQILSDQIDFVVSQIEALQDQVTNGDPTGKGYKEICEAYNKWNDRYTELYDKLEHCEDPDLELEKFKLEQAKFQHEIEMEDQEKIKLIVDYIFRGADIGVKIAVPILAVVGSVALAKLSYANDAELKLCNGRIFGGVKDVLKIATMKI